MAASCHAFGVSLRLHWAGVGVGEASARRVLLLADRLVALLTGLCRP